MELFEVVELITDLPEDGLVAGTVGTVVDIHEHPNRAYEVEFSDEDGKTLAVLALQPSQIRRRA